MKSVGIIGLSESTTSPAAHGGTKPEPKERRSKIITTLYVQIPRPVSEETWWKGKNKSEGKNGFTLG